MHVENNGRNNVNISYFFTLWRYDDEQWLPLAHKQYISNGLVAWTVPNGLSATKHVTWSFQYCSLEKGLYRLVAEADPKFAGQKYVTWDFYIPLQFNVTTTKGRVSAPRFILRCYEILYLCRQPLTV